MSKNIVNKPTVFKNIIEEGVSEGGSGEVIEVASPLELGNLDIADASISNPTGTIQTQSASAITYGSTVDKEYTNRVFLHSVVAAGGQTIPDSTYTAVDFNGSIISTETGTYTFNGTRFTNTSAVTKYFIVNANIFFTTGSGNGVRQSIIIKNRAAADTLPSNPDGYWTTYKTVPATNLADTVRNTAVVKLAQNEFFEVAVYQDSGASANISTGASNFNDQYSRLIVTEV